MAASAPTYEYFWCGTQISETDSNGTFNLNRLCSGLNQIRWTYQIGPIPRSIIVGNVVERGLDFWIDGQPQSCNATHTEPAGYFFHGTMSKITTGYLVQYMDYLKFRVNYNGNVGTGTITIAGQGKTY